MQKRRRAKTVHSNYGSLESRQLLTSFVVDTLADSSATDGLISLREAITAANTDSAFGDASAGSGADEITFAPALDGETIELTQGEFIINEGVSIRGDVTISGDLSSRIFSIDTTDPVSLESLTLADGIANDGGAIYAANNSNVSITQVTFNQNSSVGLGGGAVFKLGGVLTISDSHFTENRSVAGQGGAIYSADGHTVVIDSDFQSNEATTSGGAIQVASGSLRSEGNQFQHNGFSDQNANQTLAKPQYGGAIAIGSNARVLLQDNHFEFNTAEIGGGAIANQGGTLLSVDSYYGHNEVDGGNTAAGEGGGAILSTRARTKIVSNFSGDFDASEKLTVLDPSDPDSQTLRTPDFEFNRSNSGDGGAISAFGGSLVLTGRNILRDNFAEFDGGAISVTHSRTFLSQTALHRNQANVNGGGIAVNSHVMAHLYSVKISHNQAQARGGGAYFSATNVKIGGQDSVFSYNSSNSLGGGLYTLTRKAIITGTQASPVTFYSNSAHSGGGIYTKYGETNLRNVSMENNQAYQSVGYGGGIYVFRSKLHVAQSNFENNVAGFGADVSVQRLSEAQVSESKFDSYAQSAGGSIWNHKTSTTTIRNSTFSGTAGSRGGGIANEGQLTVVDSEFDRNVVLASPNENGGGAIHNTGTARINNSLFTENESVGNGGAIDNHATLFVTSSTFEGNVANSAHGGAIFHQDGIANVSGSTFQGNAANSGGAVAVASGVFNGRELTFGGDGIADGNLAMPLLDGQMSQVTDYRGGAFYAYGDSITRLAKSSFENNSAAGSGGAIAIQASQSHRPQFIVREKSSFIQNSTSLPQGAAESTFLPESRNGGAIANLGGNLYVRDTLFEQNVADEDGGGIFSSDEALTTLNTVTFFKNESTVSGGAIYNDAELRIANSRILQNLAETNGGIQDGPLGNSQIGNTLFRGNSQ